MLLLRFTRRLMFRCGVMLLGVVAGLNLPASGPAPVYPDLSQPLSARQPLVVGITSDSYPYGYVDSSGQLTGFSTDLLVAVMKVTNLRFERAVQPGKELHARFRAGEFDFLQALSQTPEREQYAEFSVPFLTLQGTIFIQKNGSPIKTLADFNGRKFAIIGAGSIAEKFLRDQHITVVPIIVSSSEEALHLVDRGECAGAFVSHLTALSVMERARIRNVAMFGGPLSDYDIRHCYAVHKGDAALLARLNEGLAILHGNGEYDRIYHHWFGRFNSPLITREQVVLYGAILLAIGMLAALAAWLRQRALHQRIARQAAELASQQVLLQALYDNIPLAMCVVERMEADYRILALNRQAGPLLGVAPRDATGRLLGSLVLDAELAGVLGEVLATGGTASTLVSQERRLTIAHKRVVFTVLPLDPGPQGRPRFCVLAEDVTERRSLDEEIAQSRKLRAVGELVGGIAHEFNNLLTPILLKAGVIQLDWPDDRRLQKEVQLIASTAQRAAELTRRLLTFGRKTEARAEVVQLAAVVDSCFALLRLTVDRRIQWQNNVPPNLPSLFLNPTDLNQILVNLILNARDTLLDKLATAGSSDWVPTIQIEANSLPVSAVPALPGDAVRVPNVLSWQRLTVRDNGLGMTLDVQERIYEPFYTTKQVGQGTGLGLATVWHLVHEAGGRIEVESTPGTGTAFHILLPVVPAPSAALPEKPPAAVPRQPGTHVFLAEDEEVVAQTVVAALQRLGHTVHREPDGAAAWEHLQSPANQYDLLVLDVNMPGLTGIELTQRVRAAGRYTGPILVISGRLGSEEMQQLTAAKVTAVLPKPFSIDDFSTVVRRALQSTPQSAATGRYS